MSDDKRVFVVGAITLRVTGLDREGVSAANPPQIEIRSNDRGIEARHVMLSDYQGLVLDLPLSVLTDVYRATRLLRQALPPYWKDGAKCEKCGRWVNDRSARCGGHGKISDNQGKGDNKDDDKTNGEDSANR